MKDDEIAEVIASEMSAHSVSSHHGNRKIAREILTSLRAHGLEVFKVPEGKLPMWIPDPRKPVIGQEIFFNDKPLDPESSAILYANLNKLYL